MAALGTDREGSATDESGRVAADSIPFHQVRRWLRELGQELKAYTREQRKKAGSKIQRRKDGSLHASKQNSPYRNRTLHNTAWQ